MVDGCSEYLFFYLNGNFKQFFLCRVHQKIFSDKITCPIFFFDQPMGAFESDDQGIKAWLCRNYLNRLHTCQINNKIYRRAKL